LLVDERGHPTYGSGAALDERTERVLHEMARYMHACTAADHPVGVTLASRQLGVYELDCSTLDRFAVSVEHRELLGALKPTAVVIVPLTDRDDLLGALVFAMVRQSGRRFAPQDIALVHEVGRRAALAIVHARMYDAAQQAIRTRDQLMATLSHDLKNPIGTARMAFDFALDIIPNDQSHGSVLATLAAGRRAADRMLRLVHDLLDATAIEAGRFVVVRAPERVEALVTEAVDAQKLTAQAARVRLEECLARDLPPVLVDRDRIGQVFSNLIGNALKFTPAGGRVRVGAASDGDGVRFTVSDTGQGIPSKDLGKIFDRFWRANSADRTGSGLGLAISRGIVSAHGGEITVKSEPGLGSEFSFTVPAAPAPPAP
ncbi:MAG TPA: HAMP domain-containing sensor histidine kinase, partial [Gemmatimonadaceae bacterium]|nr:HAMP domain-containing sensor histidine kinase [Gemmatimonadaceae bacterium]